MMKILRKLIIIAFVFLFFSCSKEIEKENLIKEKNIELQVLEAYKEGIRSLESGDSLFAASKFNEVEILYPQSIWAPKAALMAGYAYYIQDYYGDAIAEMERFIRIYPTHKDIDYAYYILAISYYEQIVDEKKDLKSIIKAQESFQLIINKFPKSDYAKDANFKLDLISEILASKEMYIARYYFEKKKWIPAINRFKKVVDQYQTTVFIEEALYRLVEIHYVIGLKDEAEKYAKLLGYNYQSSKWYEKSYEIFDKSEVNNFSKLPKNKKDNLITKTIKSLFE